MTRLDAFNESQSYLEETFYLKSEVFGANPLILFADLCEVAMLGAQSQSGLFSFLRFKIRYLDNVHFFKVTSII